MFRVVSKETCHQYGNSEIRIPENAVGIRGKINELCPPNRFVNRGEASEPHHVEAAPDFSDKLKDGTFNSEIFLYIRAFFPLISGDCVKGREFRPIPESVAANEARVVHALTTSHLSDRLVEATEPVKSDKDGSNRLLVAAAMELLTGQKVDGHMFKSIDVTEGQAREKEASGKHMTLFRTYKWSKHPLTQPPGKVPKVGVAGNMGGSIQHCFFSCFASSSSLCQGARVALDEADAAARHPRST